jgi:hypothetical protein
MDSPRTSTHTAEPDRRGGTDRLSPGAAPTDVAGPDQAGIQFPSDAQGRRSSTATTATVMAAAGRELDPELADAIEREPRWRQRYGHYLVELVALAVQRGTSATSIARNGLETIHGSFQFVRDGEPMTPREALRRFDAPALHTGIVEGTGERQSTLVVPYRGEALAGAALQRQIDAWLEAGVIEASAAAALHRVCEHSDWLDLRDQQFVLLGAAAEMGPFDVLSGLGANLIAVDLDRPDLWEKLLRRAAGGAGRMAFPLKSPVPPDADPRQLASVAGANLLTMAPELRSWLASLDGPLCIGGYAYLHGRDHVRVEVAMDAIMEDLAAQRQDVSLAFLLTPTDVFAVPVEAGGAAQQRFSQPGLSQAWRRPLHALTGGRLYAPNVSREAVDPDGRCYGVYDGVVPAQGPNYALAKRIQKWRALAARAAGTRVSANVAPATLTASVLARRAFAAAYAGAGHYGVEIFEPATANAVMAALLIHDLRADDGAANPTVALDHPLQLFMDAAVHGGMWRTGYQLRSVIEIAAIRGLLSGGARRRS